MRRWVALLLLTVLVAFTAPPAPLPSAESRPATASTAPGPAPGLATLERGAAAPTVDAQRPSPFGFTTRAATPAVGRTSFVLAAAGLARRRFVRDARAFIRRACWQFKAPASHDAEPPRIG